MRLFALSIYLMLSFPGLAPPERLATASPSCGDVNGDGVVNILDVVVTLQIAVGLVEATESQRMLSDLDQDGEIMVADAMLSLRGVVGQTEISACGPKRISFSGYEWEVKASSDLVNPGPSYFSSGEQSVWVDAQGRLHMKLTKRNGRWYAAEVGTRDSFGRGTYRFYLEGRLDMLDENVVLGLFTWDNDAPEDYYREIDIEFSRWGYVENPIGYYTVQPASRAGNLHSFEPSWEDDLSLHTFEWQEERIVFKSCQGHDPGADAQCEVWDYTGADNPPPGGEKARINLWLDRGRPPSDGQEVEIIVTRFEFVP